MAESVYEIPPSQRKLLLENMLNGPAFAIFLDKWEEAVIGAIDLAIFNPETNPEQTHRLKLVRQALNGTHHPRKIVETIIRATTSEIQKQPK